MNIYMDINKVLSVELGEYNKNMKRQNIKTVQGGFSEAWVGIVYIIYGWLGVTISVKYGEAAAVILLCPMAVFMPLVFYLTFVDDLSLRERNNFKLTLPNLQPVVRACKSVLIKYISTLSKYVKSTALKPRTSRV
jgi:hypothetical protein